MNIKYIRKLVKKDLLKVDNIIKKQLYSNISRINQISNYFLKSKGKYIRSIITILTAKIINYTEQQYIYMAAIVELIHIATLLHDDIIDKSIIRRGKYTTNIIFGNDISILIGDFVYACAFQVVPNMNGLYVIINLISKTIRSIIEGEVLQLINCGNFNIKIIDYIRIISCKTAQLFILATQIVCILTTNITMNQKRALKRYSYYIGITIQIVNDLLDYINCDSIDKGSDIKEGKITAPLIHIIHNGPPKLITKIEHAVKNRSGINMLENIIEIMHNCQTLQWIEALIKKNIGKAVNALDIFPKSLWRRSLEALAYIPLQQYYKSVKKCKHK